jgi:hypothetical protein
LLGSALSASICGKWVCLPDYGDYVRLRRFRAISAISLAAVTGDFVLLGSEVNPVIKALRQNGIEVTAIHSHMLQEEPRLFFMHFWANDNATKLAKGLRAALDQTNSKK